MKPHLISLYANALKIFTHTHTHTHSLSLSLSLQARSWSYSRSLLTLSENSISRLLYTARLVRVYHEIEHEIRDATRSLLALTFHFPYTLQSPNRPRECRNQG